MSETQILCPPSALLSARLPFASPKDDYTKLRCAGSLPVTRPTAKL